MLTDDLVIDEGDHVDGDEQAFPSGLCETEAGTQLPFHDGLTVYQYAVFQAMQGLLAHYGTNITPEALAKHAARCANATIQNL